MKSLKIRFFVGVIMSTKVHAPMIIDDEDLIYYRQKFGIGKTPSVTEELYLFAYNTLKVAPRIARAFKTTWFHRIAYVEKTSQTKS